LGHDEGVEEGDDEDGAYELIVDGGVFPHLGADEADMPRLKELAKSHTTEVKLTARMDWEKVPTWNVYASLPEQRLLLFHNTQDIGGEQGLHQLETALKLAHLKYDLQDLRVSTDLPDLSEYSAIVFATESQYLFNGDQANTLKDYIAGGGGAAVLYRGYNRILREAFGIYNPRDPEFFDGDDNAQFVADLFPGANGLIVERKNLGRFSYLDILTLEGVAPIAAFQGSGRPLIWSYRFGEGRTIFWNNDWLAIKQFRGFAIQSILSVMPAAGQAIANWATIQVDDFPNAPSIAEREPLATEYNGIRFVDWVHEVWVPDMLGLAHEFGYPYSWYVVFNYNNTVSPPFDFNEWTNATVEFNGQDVLFGPYIGYQVQRGPHEFALHGYNHISLLNSTWGSLENMVAGLEEARRRWEADSLGDPPRTYVPPNNLYDEDGVAALKAVFPTIRAIAGQSSGVKEEGGDQEFEPDARDPYFYDLPRWTDGYVFDETLRHAFERETELFLDSILREDRSVLELIDADYTFLNERLADHYGIAGITGSDFRRVMLPESSRRLRKRPLSPLHRALKTAKMLLP